MKSKYTLALTTLFFACTSFAATLVDLTQEDFRRPKSSVYQLKPMKQVVDAAGNTHIRYEQTYQDIPVYGYQVLEHRYQQTAQMKGVKPRPYSGTYVRDLEQDLPALRSMSSEPMQTLTKLKADYANAHGLHLNRLVFEQEFARTVIFINDNQEAVLAHEVNFFVDAQEGNIPARPYYLVDAMNGNVLKQWEGLTSDRVGQGPGGNHRIGFYQYGKDRPALDITSSRINCTLSNDDGKTVDAGNGFKQGTTPYSYRCRRNPIQDRDAANGAASPLNDAHYFIDVLSQFYNDNYDVAPLPFPLVMRAHYGKNYANAFWNGNSMTFGDGNEDLYPFVVLDIAAHEIAHGVTEVNSGLIYEGQSGGMNEAFSDMASRAIEYFAFGENDWSLGGGIFKDLSIKGLRFMDNPPLDGHSIDNAADYTPSLDVHFTSGVYNKAYYLLATTPGWNTMTAFDVMYFANLAYWEPTTTFASGAWGVIQTAAGMGRNVDDVVNAFQQVGIQCNLEEGLCI